MGKASSNLSKSSAFRMLASLASSIRMSTNLTRFAGSGSHPFLNECTLELSHRTDNLEHEPTGRCAQVEVVPQTDERHTIGIEVGQSVDQVLQRPSEAVDFPDEHNFKLAAVNIDHKAIKLGAGFLGARHPLINVLAHNLPTTTVSVFPKFGWLHFRVLAVQRAHSGIESDSHVFLR